MTDLNNLSNSEDIWICDRGGTKPDQFASIGLFDVNTGKLVPGTLTKTTVTDLTDIAFIGDQMYGTTPNELGTINDRTGQGQALGFYGQDGMNALVGDGKDVLLASSTTHDVYYINPATSKNGVYATIPYASAGALAFDGQTLYESVVEGGADALYNVSARKLIGYFETASGAPTDVFALADDGAEMFAVVGHDIYGVDVANAHLTLLSSDAASGIGKASGAAFVGENVHG